MSPGADGPYQHCRPLTDEEYAALKADIEQHGVLEYVHVDENGAVLVGHHRARVAAELGIEYPRHVVTGLSERDKHEYAVRLESLGRAKDSETKRWTALHLWRDPNVKISKTHLAELVSVDNQTVARWIKADDERLAQEAEQNRTCDSTPSEPERVVDARGRSMPTSYRPRQQPASPPPPAVLDDEETQEDNEKTVAPVSVQPVDAPVQPASPVVGDVLQQIAQGMDEAGTFEEVERIKRLRAMEGVRIGWLRFAERHTPDAWSEGVGPEQLAEVARDCDRLITWLERAREAARQALGPRRVEA